MYSDNIQTIEDPVAHWRRVGFVTPNIAVSGDLDTRSQRRAVLQLREWAAAGITDIVDARGEWSDQRFVSALRPSMRYHWVGTDDDGAGQSEEWFDAGVAAIMSALTDPARKVLVHCHMGVNRGPSLAFAALLALGHEPVDALDAIRAARPIAAVLYAPDAVGWWHSRFGCPEGTRDLGKDIAAVDRWMYDNPVDVRWIISRIRRAESRAA